MNKFRRKMVESPLVIVRLSSAWTIVRLIDRIRLATYIEQDFIARAKTTRKEKD